jgi:2-haloacid dehalogenase
MGKETLMKKHYPWLWFDADGTLFDYNRAEATALRKTFHALTLPFEQEITPAVLRFRRFELLLESLRLSSSPHQMSTAYIEQLAICSDLMDGAYEVLQTLHGRSQLAIVTNGLQAVQRSRLAHSRIRDFITELVISEEVGAAKPQPAFFDAAFARTGHPPKSDVLIIGDSLTSDIQGGVDYGLDTCWYNPTAEPRPDGVPITYEIRHLPDLLKLLD